MIFKKYVIFKNIEDKSTRKINTYLFTVKVFIGLIKGSASRSERTLRKNTLFDLIINVRFCFIERALGTE